MEKEKMKKQVYKEVKEKLEIAEILHADKCVCLYCKKQMIKYQEDKSLFDGAITFHFIKLQCPRCKKKYLDLEEAKKYDLFLKLRKMGKEKALITITEEKAKEIYA